MAPTSRPCRMDFQGYEHFALCGDHQNKGHWRKYIRQSDANIERLLGANGNLADVLREIDSARIQVEFGQKQSNPFRTAADLVEESTVAAFIVKPYVLAGAVTKLVAKLRPVKPRMFWVRSCAWHSTRGQWFTSPNSRRRLFA